MPPLSAHGIRGAFVTGSYRWGNATLPDIPFCDAVMYHLHVRGFTMGRNSGVRQKGTFAGLRQKIPYLKSLGVNQVKLMPVYDFPEIEAPVAPSGSPKSQAEAMAHALDPQSGVQPFRRNFWGYGTGFYFAPKASYAATERADVEFKDMIKAFHAAGIEVLLEFSFHAGADIGMICDCLSYWASEYHIDGFSLVGRENLADELARLPLFCSRKLICSWYSEDTVSANAEETHYQIAQSNNGFMNDCRQLLKGDANYLEAFSWRMRQNPSGCAQINYMTNHDGFTLLDLVSYNMKHNEQNGEMGRDGSASDFSWNCGEEGPSGKRGIARLRMRQRKNACAMMLLSQGTPMLMAGDEFGNSQNGNNNPWCHDSELTWLDWNHTKAGRELTEFVRRLIAYRKEHRVLRQNMQLQCTDYLSSGYPDLSFHGERAWYGDLGQSNLHMGCMYSGHYAGEEGFLYIAWNFHWEEQQLALPLIPDSYSWFCVMDTSLTESFPPSCRQRNLGNSRAFSVTPRTVVILEGKKDDTDGTAKQEEKPESDKTAKTDEPGHMEES
ncbi:MAG: hypothetical protein LUI07_04110 [Lachnospiraceae bacterium]|nr:hypothetical protein [Lachnospiraceae bacterium]